MQYNIINTVQYNVTQYNAMQCNTIQHNVIQLDTSHKIKYARQPSTRKIAKMSRTHFLHYKDAEMSRT